jgi:hypothetical protein
MKFLKPLLVLFISLNACKLNAQEVNWRNLNELSKHLASGSFGADYSSYYGFSYGYILNASRKPIVIGADFNLPFGKNMLDDWKIKIAAQREIWHSKNVSFSLKPAFIARRYESEIASLYNISADLTLLFGYMKPKWGLTAIINYDHSFMNYIENDLLKVYYPEIRNGWYGSSGGNFKFGARANLSVKTWNGFLTIGKTYSQNFNDNPTLPFFAEITIQKSLHKSKN